MGDTFEDQLAAMFDQAPAMSDTAQFVQAVEQAMKRQARRRMGLILGVAAAGCGVSGALAAAPWGGAVEAWLSQIAPHGLADSPYGLGATAALAVIGGLVGLASARRV